LAADGGAGLAGQTVAGRYRIQRQLGEGGMGSVHLAHDLELSSRPVVLKFPRLEKVDDAGLRLRFLDEVRSLASVDHPHIIKIHDAGEHQGLPFAVVQYVGGGDLQQLLERQGVQTPDEVLGWLRGICDALDYVHARGLCHRDVKPANIFFDEQGHAFLSDFGIATADARSAGDADSTQYHSQRTAIGHFVGSPSYAPPEAVRRKLGPAYDQYSLAVTIYEALTGALPVEAETSMELMLSKNNVAARDVRERLPSLPARSASALMRALSIAPTDRFESCAALYQEFAAGIEEARAPAVTRPGPARAVAIALGGAVLILLVWVLLREVGPAAPGSGSVLAREPGPLVLESLHRVELGSSEEEFRRAVELCRRYESGCDVDWFASEELRRVVLAPYALDLYEVSAGEFSEFVQRTGYVTSAEKRGYSHHRFVKVDGRSWRNPGDPGTGYDPSLPVVHVSAFDAEAFCAAAGMRLPSQDEWEFGARGDERRVFPWGDDWDDGRASWGHDDITGLEPVRSRPESATPLGHQHMAGNVAEWTSSGAGPDRIIKGGSWQDANPAMLRGASRTSESAEYSSSDVGFRCASDPRD